MGAIGDLAKETKLSGRNHVLDCRDIVEHSPIFFILDVLVFDVIDGDV